MSCFLGFSCSLKSCIVVFTFEVAVTSSALYKQALDSPVSPARDSEAFSDLSIDAPATHFLFPLGRRSFLRLYPFSQSCKTRPCVEGPSFVSQGQCPKLLMFLSLNPSCRVRAAFCTCSLAVCRGSLFLAVRERGKGLSEEFGVLGMTVGPLGFIDEASSGSLVEFLTELMKQLVERTVKCLAEFLWWPQPWLLCSSLSQSFHFADYFSNLG